MKCNSLNVNVLLAERRLQWKEYKLQVNLLHSAYSGYFIMSLTVVPVFIETIVAIAVKVVSSKSLHHDYDSKVNYMTQSLILIT